MTHNGHCQVGGAELQQVFIAREFVKCGYDVSFIVANYGHPRVEYIDGLRIIKASALFRGGKISYATTLCALFFDLWRVNAYVYYLRAPIYLLGVMGVFCKLRKRKLIFASAIDYECNPDYLREQVSLASRCMYFLGLRCADKILTQTIYQQNEFKRNFGYESTVIRNIYPSITLRIPFKSVPPIALWVGTASSWKRPELFLELAQKLKGLRFRMIIAPGLDRKLSERISLRAKTIPNVEYVGYVPYREVHIHYEQAAVLVNTSRWEGFPNTFLQAWVNNTPVVSLDVDPDGIIEKHKLGLFSRSFSRLTADVEHLVGDEQLRYTMGQNAQRYVENEHSAIAFRDKFVEIIEQL